MKDKAENEKMINVPLDTATKARLERRAYLNGRATIREAAAIIKAALGSADETDGESRT